ncbi:peptidoglycan editing factor PgeF [Metabacillus herbersteinensis]|uniref:Purine nucleoside phosphorylase n=1 Tax=Metabacillus herbersteinensis TaxID=283816 RepID=A0ABV6GC08_9BACI
MLKEPFQDRGNSSLKIDTWNELNKNIVAGFTSKHGGKSKGHFESLNLGLHVHDSPIDVIKNREILANSLSFPLSSWVFADQIHSNRIEKVSKNDRGQGAFSYQDSILKSDGLYTDSRNVMLALCYADCVPLYFVAPERSLIGLAHAGWKGTVQDIAGEMVRKWQTDEGVLTEEISVVIGPAIGECCYIVDDHVISHVKPLVQNELLPYNLVSEGQYQLNLKLLNKQLLIKAGIKEKNIVVSNWCTSCEDKLFFSHRRDQGKTGRMLSYVGLKGRLNEV